MSDIALPTVGRPRKIAFYLVVGFFSLLIFGFLTFAVPLLPSVVIGWFDRDLFGIHQLHEMNNGAISLLVLVGMVVQLRRPRHKLAGLLMALAAVGASFLVSLATGNMVAMELPFLLFPLAALALHPARGELRRLGRVGRPALLALVAVAAVPLLVYAFRQLNLQLSAPAADTHAQFRHYSAMAGIATAIVVMGLLASFDIGGWRLPAWGAGFLVLFLGLTSLVFPLQASSLGTIWAVLALVWGVAFIGVTEWERRRTS